MGKNCVLGNIRLPFSVTGRLGGSLEIGGNEVVGVSLGQVLNAKIDSWEFVVLLIGKDRIVKDRICVMDVFFKH